MIKYNNKKIILATLLVLNSCSLNYKDSVAKKLNKYDKDHYKDFHVDSKTNNNKFLNFIDISVNNKQGYAVGILSKTKNKKFSEDTDSEILYTPFLNSPSDSCKNKIVQTMEDLFDDELLNSSTGSQDSECVAKTTIQTTDLILKEASFSGLDNWEYENFKHAMISFKNSCIDFARSRQEKMKPRNSSTTYGNIKEWRKLCEIAVQYEKRGLEKVFFERYFTPFLVQDNPSSEQIGTFTGYFIYELNASKKQTGKFKYPIYGLPKECKVSSECKLTRKEINDGAIAKRGLELLWTDSYLDLFFLQIQGSGIANINGKTKSILFSGTNKYDYMSIFKDVAQDKKFQEDTNFSKSYRQMIEWLRKNPDKMLEYSVKNPRYTFFKLGEDDKVYGAQGVPLTPARSIAVDPKFIPYGMPMWVETSMAVKPPFKTTWLDFDKLVIAQDTGNAIRGKVRADIFYGNGKKAEFLAKNQKFQGVYFMLLPIFAIEDLKEQQLSFNENTIN